MQNEFLENISKEAVSELSIIHFTGEVIVVDCLEAIDSACDELLKSPIVGFDTETRPSFKAGHLNKVALLQLSTATKCFLFRLNRVRLDKAILKIIESKEVLKIGADIKGDIKALQQLRHFTANNFLDLQTFSSQWGIQEKSLRKLSAIVLGCKISKAQRLSNWEAVTLTPQQQRYAATDAWVCAEIYNKLVNTDIDKHL